MQIPSEQKLEKPHKAYVAINVDFSYIITKLAIFNNLSDNLN